MKKYKKILVFIMLIILIIVITPIYSKADFQGYGDEYLDVGPDADTSSSPFNNPGVYNPNMGLGSAPGEDVEIITSKVSKIVGAITTIGIVISVVTMIILGIKYMVGSIEEKAEYKKSMIPYIIGAVMLLSTSTIVKIIASLVEGSGLLSI